MTTSGSTNYAVTRDEIITEALEIVGAIANGDTPDANDVTSAARTLNMMIKHWQSRGVALWKTQELYVPLIVNRQYYNLGPSGDPATASIVKTEVATAASSGATTLVVDSISGISASDNIGIELDGGDLQWTTVSGAPSGSTITLAAALTDDVSVDAWVLTYTTGISRPLFITDASFYNASGVEIPMRGEGRLNVPTYTTTGPATIWNYDPQLTNGKLRVWPYAASVQGYLVLTARMPLEDFDASTDNPDFPQEWLLPLAWNLAVLIAPKFNEQLSPAVISMAGQFLADAMDSAVDSGSIIFEME